MGMSNGKIMIRMGKPEKLGRKLSQATFSTTNVTRNRPELKPRCRGENLEPNYLSYGTMCFYTEEMK
jgi:hypothetical protein